MCRIGLLTLLFALTSSAVSAQIREGAKPNLETILSPGMTVWISDSGGREEKIRVVGVSGGVLTAASSGIRRRFRTSDVTQVKVRRSDSLLNGALIGAGAGVAAGLLLCRATEPWENCRDDIGPLLRFGALGAGIGMGVDALIRGQRTIYPQRTNGLHAAPVVGRHRAGLQFSLVF